MIPPVRRWRVRFLRAGQTVEDVRVDTVNRRFARWLALEKFPAGRLLGTETKVSPAKQTCPAAVPACNSSAYSRMK
jgi:hypothetical protein